MKKLITNRKHHPVEQTLEISPCLVKYSPGIFRKPIDQIKRKCFAYPSVYGSVMHIMHDGKILSNNVNFDIITCQRCTRIADFLKINGFREWFLSSLQEIAHLLSGAGNVSDIRVEDHYIGYIDSIENRGDP